MTNDAKQEKNLNRIHKKLQILTPIIQDARQSCLDILKILVTISISLNGGAILIIAENSYDEVFGMIAPFIVSLILTFIGCISFIVYNNMTLCEKNKFILSKNNNLNEAICQIQKSKNMFYGAIFIFFSLGAVFFTWGQIKFLELFRVVQLYRQP